MQERLLAEPDTCPCRQPLLSAHMLGQDSCAGTLGQGQMMAQPAKAWAQLSLVAPASSSAGQTGPLSYSNKGNNYLLWWQNKKKERKKIQFPFLISTISWSVIALMGPQL